MKGKTNCYLLLKTGETWKDQKAKCASLGGDLASIHDGDEELFLFSVMLDSRYGAYIGLQRKTSDGPWTWTDGSHLDYQKWLHHPREGEHCAFLTYESFARDGWSTAHCDAKGMALCKKPAAA